MQVDYRSFGDGYRVGSDGSVWTCWNKGPGAKPNREWRRMNARLDHEGYRRVTFRQGRSIKVCVLVLTLFVGDRPEGLVCRHVDGDSQNDSLENLQWATQKENIADKQTHGTMATGLKHGRAKLSEDQVTEVLSLKGTATQQQVADRFGISRGYVGQLWSGARQRV